MPSSSLGNNNSNTAFITPLKLGLWYLKSEEEEKSINSLGGGGEQHTNKKQEEPAVLVILDCVNVQI